MRVKHDPVGTHWPCDIFEALLADVIEGNIQLVAHIFVDSTRDADAAGLRQTLQTRRDVHAVPVDVVRINDDVAEIDPDAKCNPLIASNTSIALAHLLLHLDSAASCIDDAMKLNEHPIASRLHDTAVMLFDLRIDQFAPMSLQACKRSLLVCTHEAAVPRNVRSEDSAILRFTCSRATGSSAGSRDLASRVYQTQKPIGERTLVQQANFERRTELPDR